MRRPSREVAPLSLSALDVLAMATGVFVLLLVMMMPYWRNTLDAEAEASRLAAAAAAIRAEQAELTAAAAAAEARATADAAETARLEEAARRLAARALGDRRAAAAAIAPAPSTPPPPKPAPPPPQPVGTPVVAAMDLVFVVDRTASMTGAIRALAQDLTSIVRILERLVPSLRIAVVAYADRDTGQNPLTVLPLTATQPYLPRVVAFLDGLQSVTIGSRTVEEDVLLGLQAAVGLSFRPGAAQALILVGDAAAHPHEAAAATALVRRFVQAQPQRTLSALFVSTPNARLRGDIDRDFFRGIAAAGNGTFTDHAGSMIESVLASVLID